ncbi:MAG: hypothetical protein ACO1N8_05085 [Methylophilus sp.]
MQVTTYYINNIPVYIRSLPSGDIAVWHPFNLELGKIIYGICVGNGYWNAEYNNWIIFSVFCDQVVATIQSKSSHHAK